MRRWVITDIHGCYHTFKALLEQQIRLSRQDTLYLLGDYINKGPFSRQVLDYIMDLRQKGYQLELLRGNHEQEILKVLAGKSDLTSLREKGGGTFLANFGIDHPADIPEQYIHFFKELKWYLSLDQWLLVHSGFDFEAQDPYQPGEAMLTLREYTVDTRQTGGRRVLHGHTPTDLEQIIKTLEDTTALDISLDAGCVYRGNPRQGRLLALELGSWQWLSQPNIDISENYQP
ncbi:metallophosphoesterase [Cesiribacter andamanensis]|uniref:Bis(5'-nucleosyl)-tetraphosphatase, symmetrical n=1 Tax=Cesiribacter andamanensis AMV16 TaxID=1279009 RepID=M7MZ20_9BACT|nr:metallophosphoesterase [Cesiribacter andamanensis]EMR01693.1 Bis(5'-nucleosyl)-tetraphosphatase, symmetrical [Cesiribacter andamanensis AMV16]